MAIAVNGSEVKFKYGAESATTEVVGLREIPEFAKPAKETIDVTAMNDTEKKYIPGIGDSINELTFKFLYDKTTFTTPIKRLDSEKFISVYQGRLYDNGGICDSVGRIDLSKLKDYFSEGYRAYYTEPWTLKKKDPKLYAYIEGLQK